MVKTSLFIFYPDPRRKYHVKILAVSKVGDGYQRDQTISTPGCVCKYWPENCIPKRSQRPL